MYKLLIAEYNDDLRHALTDLLGSRYILKTCSSGDQAQELLHAFRPDLFMLDLMLPVVDGITLLQHAYESNLHPVTLVTISYSSDYILGALSKYGISYLMSKPYSFDALTVQLQALAATIDAALPPTQIPEKYLPSILMELGLAPKVDGFEHLLDAIPRYIADPRQGLTKELYNAVGRNCGKTGTQVERCIRTAIHSAWLRADAQVWARYFPTAPDGTIPRPSNGHFISCIATCISRQSAQHSA